MGSTRIQTRHWARRRRGLCALSFSWQDGTAGCVYCKSSGLVSGPPNRRQPKPSWGAFQQIAG